MKISATKAIIETQVEAKCYYNYSKGEIEKTAIRVNLQNENNVKAICDISELPEGRFPLTI